MLAKVTMCISAAWQMAKSQNGKKITNKEYIKKSPLGPWGCFLFIISQKISAKACIIISKLHASVYKYLVKPACQKYHRRESEMFKCLWKGRYQIKEKLLWKRNNCERRETTLHGHIQLRQIVKWQFYNCFYDFISRNMSFFDRWYSQRWRG